MRCGLRSITNRFAACVAILFLVLSISIVSCTPTTKPPVVALKPVGSPCQSIAIACYDALARQPLQIICFRPTSRWATTDLTYRLTNVLPALDEQMQRDALDQAFALWADASQLTFTAVTAGADLNISFVAGDHGDTFPFDGSGSNLGHAYFPGSGRPGDVHLCDTENWVIGGSQEGDIDLFTVLVHEIGHALGVEHSLNDDAVMWPSYMGSIVALAEDDIDSIQKLYGSADGTVSPLETPSPADFKEPANFDITIDPDTDGDGIPDTIEVYVLNTDPVDEDSDGDGTPDFMEVFVGGTDPIVSSLTITGPGSNKLQVQLSKDDVEATVFAVGDGVSIISSVAFPDTTTGTEFYQLTLQQFDTVMDPLMPVTNVSQLSILVDDTSVLDGTTYALADFPGLVQIIMIIDGQTTGGQVGTSELTGSQSLLTGTPAGSLTLTISGGRLTGSFDMSIASIFDITIIDQQLQGANSVLHSVANNIDISTSFQQMGSEVIVTP